MEEDPREAMRTEGSSDHWYWSGCILQREDRCCSPGNLVQSVRCDLLADQRAQWLGQQIINALQSVINGLLHGPLDIITQTPPADTCQKGTVITWANAFLAVVDLALASLIVIGGYNVIVGRGLGLPYSALPGFLPRLLLAFGAAHFSLFFLGLFIDLENALSGVALDLASHSMLTNVIAGIFQGNLLGEGFLVVVRAIVLGSCCCSWARR